MEAPGAIKLWAFARRVRSGRHFLVMHNLEPVTVSVTSLDELPPEPDGFDIKWLPYGVYPNTPMIQRDDVLGREEEETTQ